MAAASNFRPNPSRSIYIQGIIDQNLIDRLTPSILSLKHSSTDPITVYIDSRGGSTASAELLSQLLQSPNQDASSPHWIITVATGRAASAAADLLTEGNYSLVYPYTVIHFHGIRYSLENPLTVEDADSMAESLKFGNERFALTLADRCISRFLFRFLHLRPQFAELRAQHPQEALDDLSCMRLRLADLISPGANRIIEQAFNRYGRYESLLGHVRRTLSASAETRLAETEAEILRAIIDFELQNNQAANWSFEDTGLRLLRDDFLLLMGYFKPWQSDSLESLCDQWGVYFLPTLSSQEQDRAQLNEILRPFWFFFVALCHVLQEGENELSAKDCYWLGLIDEIAGESMLPNLRQIVEYAPAGKEDGA